MKLTDLIDKEYETIDSSTIKRNVLENNPNTFGKLVKEYESFLLYAQRTTISELECKIEKTLPKFFRKHPWTSRNITELSLILKNYEVDAEFVHSGYFLSYLINHLHLVNSEEKYLIVTKHLNKKINALCKYNESDVTIDGNAGDFLCKEMISGTVVLQGDAETFACDYMSGGIVTITGNTKNLPGSYLKGGKIKILKNAGYGAGAFSEGGKILIYGNAESECGYEMIKGIIEVKGNCGDDLGRLMKGGTIRAHGTTGENVGDCMEGGIIYLLQNKKKKQLGIPSGNNGRIYVQGKQIFPSERRVNDSEKNNEKIEYT